MQVLVVFQFYMPFVLPRAPDWHNQAIGFKDDKVTAVVHPRNEDEDLYPADIDIVMSTMELRIQRISQPTGRCALIVGDRCLDRVQVAVNCEASDLSEARQAEFQETILRAAVAACNTFLDHCRAVGQTPFVTGVQREFRLQDQRYYVLTPHTISWYRVEDGARIPVYSENVNARASSGALRSPERGMVTMASIIGSMASGPDPDLALSLLMDAEERLTSLHLREAIVALGTACEVASDYYLQRLGKVEEESVERILRQRNTSFTTKRFHLLPCMLSRRSLQHDEPQVFDLVDKTYRTRNKLAHEGRLCFEVDGGAVVVDQRLATEFYTACRRAVEWISALKGLATA